MHGDEPGRPAPGRGSTGPVAPWVQGAFELAKAGFTLLAERYPDNLRFADVSRSGQQSMMDLQLFAEGERLPALSPEQTRQAVAAGTLEAGSHPPRSRKRPGRPRRAGAAAGTTAQARAPGAAAPAAAGARTRCAACTPAGRQRKRPCAAASRALT